MYQIINSINGHFYIGSTYDFRVRRNRHLFNLRRGTHENDHLQKAFNLYGEEAFRFILIEALEPEYDEQLWAREQYYIDQLQPVYNIAPKAGGTIGYKMTAEQLEKLKIRDENRLPDSPETKRRKSEGLKKDGKSKSGQKNLRKTSLRLVKKVGRTNLRKGNSKLLNI